jgi:phosphoribosylaminoimidazolecarboxamide formyltransferase/IMP cyclohydrolase
VSKVARALLSVSDKSGIVELARALAAAGVQIISTGGTAKLLEKEGVKVTEVSAHTGFAEMLDGRVKTLHPKIHAACSRAATTPAHLAAIKAAGIEPIDLLVVNLYPFRPRLPTPTAGSRTAIENIDIGGPAMLRAAAKNYTGVAVVVDPRTTRRCWPR